jgi:phage terminase large subunit-like protein
LQQTADPEIAEKLVPYNPKGDKEKRGYEASKWCEKGVVHLPPPSDKYPWLYEFEDELFSFPDSIYKDQVDAFNQLILYTNSIGDYLETASKNIGA